MAEKVKDIRDYWAIFLKRKRYFIIPFLTVLIIASAIAYLLPSIYESSSTILIQDQQIPPDFVRSTVTGFADQRIQSLTQQILSRTKLGEIIQQFNLYKEMQEKFTREEILEYMRDDIKLETISAEIADQGQGKKSSARRPNQPEVTIAFSIAYRGKHPDTVQKVDGTLASLYLEENLKTREEQAKSTTQFLETELKGLEERIAVLGNQLETFKKEHEGIQPELYQFNLTQADRLESEIQQLDNSIRAAEDRRIYIEAQLATVKPDTPMISPTGERVMDPQARYKALEVALADLQSKYSNDHPDIRKVQREMAELEKLLGQKGGSASMKRQKLTQLKAELAQEQGRYSDEHPDIRKLKGEIARLEQSLETPGPVKLVTDPENPAYITLSSQVEASKSEVASLQRQRAALKEKVAMYNKRLEETPKWEQEYMAVARDYNNATTKHQEVMNKILEARISQGMEETEKGDKFTLIDPASYPEKPVSPKRWLIILAGFMLSLGSGLGTVALVEELDHSVKSARELSSLTGLPVLGAIARIQTKEDLSQSRRQRRLIWGGSGLILILGLTLFHFLYMDLWVLTATLLRLVNKYT